MDQSYRTPLDLAIEVGWQFYQDAICPKCGVPWWYGRSTDSRVQFKIEETTCYSCAELEQTADNRPKSSAKRYGVTDQAIPTGVYYEAVDTSDPLPLPFALIH